MAAHVWTAPTSEAAMEETQRASCRLIRRRCCARNQDFGDGPHGYMAIVRTVLGDIDPSALGRTNAHEHLFIRNGLILILEPDFRLDSEANAVSEVADFRSTGVPGDYRDIPLGVGRDPEGLYLYPKQPEYTSSRRQAFTNRDTISILIGVIASRPNRLLNFSSKKSR